MADKAEILAAEETRCAILKAADGKRLAALLTDEFMNIHTSGKRDTKAEYVAMIETGPVKFTGFSHDNVYVQVVGDTAVMAGDILIDRDVRGKADRLDFRFVGVWAKSGSGWKLAFWQHVKKD